MPIQITIRNVPENVPDRLAARAALRRQSMQEYIRGELERLATRPSVDEWLARVRERRSAANRHVPADTILAHRDADRR